MTAKKLVRITYFTLLTVLGALICYKCGGFPLTVQAFFAVLSGIVLGGADGAVSQLLYIIIGIIGLPVFAFGGGYAYATEPTFGYLIGMAIGAYVSGAVFRRFKTLKVWTVLVAGLIGLVPLYLVGMAYQTAVLALMRGYTAKAIFAALLPVPISFALQTVLLLLISLIYPRLMTMIGKIREEKFTDGNAALE